MHHVKNTSEQTKTFNVADPAGGFRRVTLQPGESGDYNIDPNQGRFQTGELKVSAVRDKAPAARKAAAKIKPRGRATPKASANTLPNKPAPGVLPPEDTSTSD